MGQINKLTAEIKKLKTSNGKQPKKSRSVRLPAERWGASVNTPWFQGAVVGGDDLKKSKPRNRNMNTSGQIIEQDELISVVNGNTTFAATRYQINPGDARSFPWLAKVAQLYQKYRILKMVFYYKPSVSEYDPSGTRGKIVLTCDYDSNSTTMTSLPQAMAMVPHVDGLLQNTLLLELDPYKLTPVSKVVRTGLVPAGGDVLNYDAGTLFIAAAGSPDDQVIGELHCRYSIEFIQPTLSNEIPGQPNFKAAKWTGARVALPPGAFATLAPVAVISDRFGPEPNGIGMGIQADQFSMQPGYYHGVVIVDFGGVSGVAATEFHLVMYINGTIQGSAETVVSGTTRLQSDTLVWSGYFYIPVANGQFMPQINWVSSGGSVNVVDAVFNISVASI